MSAPRLGGSTRRPVPARCAWRCVGGQVQHDGASVVALDVEDVSEDDAGLRLVLRRSKTTKPQIDLYARLDLSLPKKVIEITPAGR